MRHTCYSKSGDCTYDVELLWVLSRDLPVVEVPLWTLIPNLFHRFWQDGDTRTCAAISTNPYHVRKVEKADMSYPLLMHHEGWLMDGAHRLTKAWQLGLTAIPVRVIPPEMAKEARL